MVSTVLVVVSALNAGIGSSIGIGLKCGIDTSLIVTSYCDGIVYCYDIDNRTIFPQTSPMQ